MANKFQRRAIKPVNREDDILGSAPDKVDKNNSFMSIQEDVEIKTENEEFLKVSSKREDLHPWQKDPRLWWKEFIRL